MLKTKTQEYLTGFNKFVIDQSKVNLIKGQNNVSKELHDSIGGDVKISPNSFEISFRMEGYGKFQDFGVKGKTSSLKAPNSPFRFGTGTGIKGGLTQGINQWVRHKRFQFQDRKSGKFLSYDSTAFLITRSVYHKGIKPMKFFTNPFNVGFEKMPDELIEAYGLDVETFLKYTLR